MGIITSSITYPAKKIAKGSQIKCQRTQEIFCIKEYISLEAKICKGVFIQVCEILYGDLINAITFLKKIILMCFFYKKNLIGEFWQ